MTASHHIAIDLGAESGRVMLGTLENDRLALEEIHRFPTGGIAIGGSLRWDLLRAWDEIKSGLKRLGGRGIAPASVSTDAWGVDYVLIREGEPLLALPFHYRDSRTEGGYERAFAQVSAEEIFAESGIQFMLINTLYQLHADARIRPAVLAAAQGMLMDGDWFNWLLSGKAVIEESNASTTQLYNPRTRAWSQSLIGKLGLPKHLFGTVVPSGTVLGPVQSPLAAELGLAGAQVVATCSHDTGAAVAAVPGEGDGWAYLSSGTWSLLGVENPVPVITEASRTRNFTNEIGLGGSIRLLKNIVGLWVVQECRRAWADAGTEHTYEALTAQAQASPAFASLINPADARFVRPGDMPKKVADYCKETGQAAPATPGAFVRCALESLALSYRRTLEEVAEISGRKLTRLHIVGGGTKNALLNQFAADATGRTVVCGPVEATAIGNVLMQALALGRLRDHAHLRAVVRASFGLTTYQPADTQAWDAAYRRFRALP